MVSITLSYLKKSFSSKTIHTILMTADKAITVFHIFSILL